VKVKKLVCDKCGFELTDKYDIELTLDGQWAWEEAIRAKGSDPRGIYPCKHFHNCGGEMLIVKR
jgi:hypothetical protein